MKIVIKVYIFIRTRGEYMTDIEKNKVKNLLYAWGSYKYIISAEKRELEDIKLMYRNMTDIKEICMDTPVKKARVNSSVQKAFKKNLTLCEGRLEKLNKLIKSNMEKKIKIDEVVDSLPYEEQYVLKARYVKNLEWTVMPLNLPFFVSKRQCQRIHKSAMEKIYDALKNNGELL